MKLGASAEHERGDAIAERGTVSSSAFNIASGAHSLEMVGVMALAWIDYDFNPRVIVADDLTIIWANAAARSALARRRDVENRAGIFSAVNSQHQQPLIDFILAGGALVSSWCIERTDGDGQLILRTQRIDWGENGVFGVTFFGSGDDFVARFSNLDAVFGLTRTESGVLADLLQGQGAERIAGGRQVSIETIRTHIRKIYAKLGVATREALFRRVQPFRI